MQSADLPVYVICVIVLTMVLIGGDIRKICPSFSFDTSVLQLLLDCLQKQRDKLFQVEAWSEKTIVASEFLQQSCRVAAELCSKGVTAGDYVVICCDKSILAYISLLATFFTGATAVILPTQAAGDVFNLTKHAFIKAIFCEESNLEKVRESVQKFECRPSLIVPLIAGHEVLKHMLESQEEFHLYQVQDVEKHVPLIMFTSGSTGDPKGVLLSDRALQRLGYSFDDEELRSYLLISSFNWISSHISFISSIIKGYSLVLGESSCPGDILQLIEKYQINGWTVNAQSLNYYINEPSLPDRDLSSLTSVIIGGDIVMTRVAKRFIKEVLKDRIGVKSLYGMTESGILTTWRDVVLLDTTKTDSSGYLAPGVQVKVVSLAGEEVTVGCIGEILVKSLSMMSGYWKTSAELEQGVKDQDGFLRTGDVGYFDTDGYLYIRGRVSNMAYLGGSKFATSALEDVLKSHHLVLEAVVVGESSSTGLKNMVACVVKRSDSTLTAEDLLQYLKDQMGDCSLLNKGIIFLENLPKTVNFKIKRTDLGELLKKETSTNI